MQKFSALILLFVILISCSTVPITGRKSFNIIPTETINSMSFQEYGNFLQSNKVINNTKQAGMVKKVGKNIRQAVEKYFADKGMSNQLNGYAWEFNLVESKDVNAWCMPGGKVVVYTGILPITKNATGLAVVMGHEIAHAIAGHGSERMSQGMVTQMGGMALSKALEQKPQETQQLWMTAFGVGAQFGYMLPFSRLHENEADHLGLIFMAMAGYNPEEAVNFWQRMSEMKGASIPEFMSTHPSDQTRINNLRELLPEAMTYYKKN